MIATDDWLAGPALSPLPPGPPGAFRATAACAHFHAPVAVPAGWLRIRLRLRRLDSARPVQCAELSAEPADGAGPQRLERFVGGPVLTEEALVCLPRPARALRLDVLDCRGDFALEVCALRPVSRLTVLTEAARRKWRLVRACGCTSRVVGRGLKLLLTGRLGDLRRKLLGGLADARRLRVADDSARAAAWGTSTVHRPTSTVQRKTEDRKGEIPRFLFDVGRWTVDGGRSLPGPPLFLSGDLAGLSGFDCLVFEVLRGLLSAGIDVRLNAAATLRPELVAPALLDRSEPMPAGAAELIVAPPTHLGRFGPGPRSVVLTMWESDRLRPEWVRALNRAARVVVPSAWVEANFRAAGVTAPLVRVPLGHDPLTYHPAGRFPAVCTFGTAAALDGGGVRKNTQLVIALFRRAFPSEADVRLRVKVSPASDLPDCDDPRVQILRAFLPAAELADWYRSLTAFVSAAAAEGFGLHQLEVLACGRPLVSTVFGGVTEFFDEAVGLVVPHRLVPADAGPYRGTWAEPDDDGFVAALRTVYENRGRAEQLGARAAARARCFTWADTGRRLLAVLDDAGLPS